MKSLGEWFQELNTQLRGDICNFCSEVIDQNQPLAPLNTREPGSAILPRAQNLG